MNAHARPSPQSVVRVEIVPETSKLSLNQTRPEELLQRSLLRKIAGLDPLNVPFHFLHRFLRSVEV